MLKFGIPDVASPSAANLGVFNDTQIVDSDYLPDISMYHYQKDLTCSIRVQQGYTGIFRSPAITKCKTNVRSCGASSTTQ